MSTAQARVRVAGQTGEWTTIFHDLMAPHHHERTLYLLLQHAPVLCSHRRYLGFVAGPMKAKFGRLCTG